MNRQADERFSYDIIVYGKLHYNIMVVSGNREINRYLVASTQRGNVTSSKFVLFPAASKWAINSTPRVCIDNLWILRYFGVAAAGAHQWKSHRLRSRSRFAQDNGSFICRNILFARAVFTASFLGRRCPKHPTRRALWTRSTLLINHCYLPTQRPLLVSFIRDRADIFCSLLPPFNC